MLAIKLTILSCCFVCCLAHSCEIKKDVQIYSLSGPITMLLEEMELLSSSRLLAISIFHPVKNYSGRKLGGGIFLTKKSFNHKGIANVFYDKSLELTKALKQKKNIKLHQVDSRGRGAIATTIESINSLKPLLNNCERKLNQLNQKMLKLKEDIKTLSLKKYKLLFYLNAFKEKNKKPKMIIVNDGFVKDLLGNDKVKSYPSKLSYINWSSKIMKSLEADYVHFGITEAKGESDQITLQKLEERYYNLRFRGALTPGIRQAVFIEKFILMNQKGKFGNNLK